MEEKNWLQAFEQKNQIGKVLDTNQYTEKYGLVLSEKEAQLIVSERTRSLKEQKRVEFGNSILPEIIYDSVTGDFLSL